MCLKSNPIFFFSQQIYSKFDPKLNPIAWKERLSITYHSMSNQRSQEFQSHPCVNADQFSASEDQVNL